MKKKGKQKEDELSLSQEEDEDNNIQNQIQQRMNERRKLMETYKPVVDLITELGLDPFDTATYLQKKYKRQKIDVVNLVEDQ